MIRKNKIVIDLIKKKVFIRGAILVSILGNSYNSLLLIRNCIENIIYRRLKRKYKKIAAEFKTNEEKKDLKQVESNIIWICWFQGIENAPAVVRACFNSVKHFFPDKKIIVITSENINSYVKFPDFIIDRYRKGIISNTAFSDLVRLELLIKYGGLWIDATVLCTGNKLVNKLSESKSKFFMYQILKPGLDGHTVRFSSWMIYSYSNNQILRMTRYLIYTYWKENNKQISYFLLHNFLELSSTYYPEYLNKMIPFSSSVPHELLLRLFDNYDEETYNFILSQSDFHKLTYKFNKENANKENTYYKKIINEYLK